MATSTDSVSGRAGVAAGLELHDAATLHKLRMQHNSKAREQRNEMGYALNVNCHAQTPRGLPVSSVEGLGLYLSKLGFAKHEGPLAREDVAVHAVPPAVAGNEPRWFVEKSVAGEARFVFKALDGTVKTHGAVEAVVAEMGGYDGVGVPPAAFDRWLEQ